MEAEHPQRGFRNVGRRLQQTWHSLFDPLQEIPPLEAHPADEEKLGAYKAGYQESLRGITQQQAVLNELRARAGALFGVGAVATSFLGGLALDGEKTPGAIGWIAIAFFIISGVVTIFVLLPRGGWIFRLQGETILGYIEHPEAPATEAEVYRILTWFLERHFERNERRLGGLQDCVILGAATLLTEVVLFLLDLAI